MARLLSLLPHRTFSLLSHRTLPLLTSQRHSSNTSWNTSLAPAVQKLQETLNLATGYSHIEDIKTRIKLAEARYAHAREALRTTHDQLEKAHAERAEAQKEVNSLLQRKHAWEPEDVARFTELYAREHELGKTVGEASGGYRKAQGEVDEAMGGLAESLRERYWEETSWSDKMRGVSMWMTVVLVVVNLVIAVGAHGVLEPRRRRRLEERIAAMVDENGQKTRDSVVKMGEVLEELWAGKANAVLAEPGTLVEEVREDRVKTEDEVWWAHLGLAAALGFGLGSVITGILRGGVS